MNFAKLFKYRLLAQVAEIKEKAIFSHMYEWYGHVCLQTVSYDFRMFHCLKGKYNYPSLLSVGL